MIPVYYAVEGRTDEPVARKILQTAGLIPGQRFITVGKRKLNARLPSWNAAAKRSPWLVIRDLDHDDGWTCIPDLRQNLLNDLECSQFMCLRFAVRAIEAWLMADRDAFVKFFGIRRETIKLPEQLDDPKRYLTDICSKSSKRRIREDIPHRSGGKVGPGYATLMREFTEDHWDPLRARINAPSLGRALDCLAKLRGLLEQQHPLKSTPDDSSNR